ncbi:MAG: hypothetical protein ACI95R_002855, partial [Halioglobus sp.]
MRRAVIGAGLGLLTPIRTLTARGGLGVVILSTVMPRLLRPIRALAAWGGLGVVILS